MSSPPVYRHPANCSW